MKKILLVLALPLTLAACKKGPAADAERLCDLMREAKQAHEDNDREAGQRVVKEAEALTKELKAKYKDDEAAMKIMKEEWEACQLELNNGQKY